MNVRTMHLFVGIGGGLLADLILGHTPVVAVEWEPYACKVLRERAADGWFPGLHVWEGDVRLFDPSEYAGRVDCIHAGFPCQDISVAGKQAGVSEGTRSGLYREVLRIAGVVRPKQLFLENVSAILSNGLGTVLADMAALGYDTRWCCIRASDVGAPHHRDRWFLLANANSDNGRTSGLGQDAWSNGRDESCGMGEVLANSRHAGVCERGQFVDAIENVRLGIGICSDGILGGSGEEGEILDDTDSAQRQGNECAKRIGSEHADISGSGWWTTEPGLGRVANGIPHRVGQLKGYGNAQVPIQAAAAYRLLGGWK